MKYIKVERYSEYKFIPQYQSNHLKNFEYLFTESCKEDNKTLPEFLKHEVMKIQEQHRQFYLNHKEDLQKGVWVFYEGKKDRQSLNHLKKLVPCWTAELPEDIEVYDVNLTKVLLLKDFECTIFGCYVPERSLKDIRNVKRKINKK